jgi:hypothetical protein
MDVWASVVWFRPYTILDTRRFREMKQAEIARAWKVGRAYVNELVRKKGMPIDTFKTMEDATAWREMNAMRRKSPMAKPGPKFKRETGNEPEQPEQARGDGSLESALKATVRVAEQAESLVLGAMRQNSIPEIPPLLSIHTKAIEARFSAERAYREEMERRGQLIDYTKATAEFRRGFDFLLIRARRIPQAQAPRCNPENPMLALGVLETAINSLIEEAQKEYAA